MLVKEIFTSLQGEGPYVGIPATFVRLATCNLRCPWCDTDHTTDAKRMTEEEIVKKVEAILPKSRLVVLTGGEPMLQSLGGLVSALPNETLVQIETNGTLWQSCLERLVWSGRVTIVCSPKPGHLICRDVYWCAAAFKIVYGVGDPVPEEYPGEMFVQPRDDGLVSANEANLKASIALCMEKGWRLSLQVHKLLGLK